MSVVARTSAVGPVLDPGIAALTGETLIELLELAVSRTPDAIAIVIRRGMADERWTYRQLQERALRVAANLASQGVGPGDRVVTWSQNDPWLVAAYFAVWRLGAIIVPLDLRMQTDVALRIGTRTRPTLLLAGPGVDADAARALGVPMLSVDEAGLDPRDGPSQPGTPLGSPDAHLEPETVAEILFTSGTTSDPKGVVLSHAQIVHTARIIAQTGMGAEPDRGLGIIPLSHMYGQSVPLLMGLISGSTLVFLHALTPKAIRATMARERITAVTLVPQLMAIILEGIASEARRSGREGSLERARRLGRRLPMRPRRWLFRSVLGALGGELQVISSGGARLPDELQIAWESMGVHVVQGYGTTECAAICGHSRRRHPIGSVGPPLAGLEVRISSDGELLVRGPNVMTGYWDDPEATAEVLDAQGWFRTGDVAAIDETGDVVILGRTRDRIALPNGLKVYPEDLEIALQQTGLIHAAVAFEASPGRLAAALVPITPGAEDATLEEAVRRANATLAPHQRIGSWRRWPEAEFPLTHTLKVRRRPVERWYLSEADDATSASELPAGQPAGGAVLAGSALSIDALASVVADVVAETGGNPPPTLDPDTRLESLGLDSLAAVTLAIRLDEAFGAPISDDELVGLRDLKALHALVLSRRGQAPAPPPSRWAFSPAARAARRLLDATVVGWGVQLVAHPAFEGTEHLAGREGPVLICPNHSSHLDAPVVRAGLPARLRDRTAIAAAADYWFEGSPAGLAVALAEGAFPFGRTADVRASLERVADLTNDGYSVIMFPEGSRSMDGRIGSLRNGIGLLARDLRVPVVPVLIEGAHEILPKGAWLPRHRRGHRVHVRYGASLEIEPTADVPEATQRIARAIAALGEGSGA